MTALIALAIAVPLLTWALDRDMRRAVISRVGEREMTRREEWRFLREYHHDGHLLPWRSCWWPGRPRPLTQWCWRCAWREITGQRGRAQKARIADIRRRRAQTPLSNPIVIRRKP